MPKFPGGQEGLMRYLAKNIKYPTMAQQNKEQGKVLVQIVIGKDGNVSNIKILKGASAWLDSEAIRVVRGMPIYIPYYIPTSISKTGNIIIPLTNK